MATVVLVEDDSDLGELFEAELSRGGHVVKRAPDTRSAEEILHSDSYDLAILDITLGEDLTAGHQLCQLAKREKDRPVIFLTSRSDELDELLGFALGADDYLVKPISPKLLAARIQVYVRRSQQEETTSVVSVAGIHIDTDSRTVKVGGEPVKLTKTEFDLLVTLASRPTQIFTRGQIVERIWGDWFGSDHQLDVHVSRLRCKIAAAGGPKIIRATKGVGLSFE